MPAGFIYVFVVMFIRKLGHRDNPAVLATRGVETFPIWLAVFIFGLVAAGLHVFKEPARHAVFNMVKWDFSLAASALGLSLSLKDITSAGLRGFFLTCVVGVLRIVLLLAALFICVKAGLIQA